MHINNQEDTGVAGNVTTTLTVTSTQIKTLLYGQVILTTDATVANRRVIISILNDSGNVVLDLHSGAVVTASLSNRHHEFLQGIFRETTFVGDALQVPIPADCFLAPGYSVQIAIENGVAGDSYDYSLVYKVEHTVPDQVVI